MPGKPKLRRIVSWITTALLATLSAGAESPPRERAPAGKAKAIAQRPRNDGIAARFPVDKGISKDPAVVFHDDFETDEPGKR